MTLILGITFIILAIVLYFYFLRYVALDPIFRPQYIDSKLFIFIETFIPPLFALTGIIFVFIWSWIIGVAIILFVLLFLFKFSTKNTIKDTIKTLNEVYKKSESLEFCITTRPTFESYNNEVVSKIINDCRDIEALTAFILIYEAYQNRNPLLNLNNHRDYFAIIEKVRSVGSDRAKLIKVLKSL